MEDYEAGRITRRDAMATLVGLTGAALGAQRLAACGKSDNKPAPAARGDGNDTGQRDVMAAAQAAWRETMAWFAQYLNA